MRASHVALLLLLLLPAEVAAERGVPSASIFSATIFRQAVIPIQMTTLRGLQPASEPRARLAPDALHFSRTRMSDLRARERLLESLLAATDDPAVRQRVRKSVASDEVWDEFGRILRFVGYSDRNLADVTTAYYVIAWEVVSGEQAIDYLSGVRVVRDSVAQALLRNPDVAAMPDPEKQEAAAVMAYMAIVAAHRARELRRAGDAEGLDVLREQVRRSVMQNQGVDLAAIRLTNLGFVAD